MVAVSRLANNGNLPGRRVHFRCPGCDDVHGVVIDTPTSWIWNGDLERPTFSPSVLVSGVQWDCYPFHKPNHKVSPGESIVCHSFVTDGQIKFLDDSTHILAGQTVDLPPWK